jgi:hypothetical protein
MAAPEPPSFFVARETPRAMQALGWTPPRGLHTAGPDPMGHGGGYDRLGPEERDPGYLRGLGARLREQVDAERLTPELVHRAGDLVKRGGHIATAFLSAGFGPPIEPAPVARAAFTLLAVTVDARPPVGGLGPAAQSCAVFIVVMRAISAERLRPSLERLRSDLIAAALVTAETAGSSPEMAGILVKPLMEA